MVSSRIGNGAGEWLKVAERTYTLANIRVHWGHPEELYLEGKVEVEGGRVQRALLLDQGHQ